jgi:hypothetical protein
MGHTLGGLPWPENTDPVAAGAQAIRALAEALDPAWYRAERIAAFSIGGGGTDVAVGGGSAAWEVVESNFGAIIANTFTVPKAGVWRFSAAATTAIAVNTRVTVAVQASGGNSIGYQHQVAAGAGVNQVYQANGMMRIAAAETIQMIIAQNSGTANNFGVAGNSRYATRLSAQWVAP